MLGIKIPVQKDEKSESLYAYVAILIALIINTLLARFGVIGRPIGLGCSGLYFSVAGWMKHVHPTILKSEMKQSLLEHLRDRREERGKNGGNLYFIYNRKKSKHPLVMVKVKDGN